METKNRLYKLFTSISINRYFRMNNAALEAEASKWKIRSYGNSNGTIDRQVIIDALLKKDVANNSRYAIIISIFAILISIISLATK